MNTNEAALRMKRHVRELGFADDFDDVLDDISPALVAFAEEAIALDLTDQAGEITEIFYGDEDGSDETRQYR